jgi:hypothetical protein
MMGALGWTVQIQNKGAPRRQLTGRKRRSLSAKIFDVHRRFDPSTALQPGLPGRRRRKMRSMSSACAP